MIKFVIVFKYKGEYAFLGNSTTEIVAESEQDAVDYFNEIINGDILKVEVSA